MMRPPRPDQDLALLLVTVLRRILILLYDLLRRLLLLLLVLLRCSRLGQRLLEDLEDLVVGDLLIALVLGRANSGRCC